MSAGTELLAAVGPVVTDYRHRKGDALDFRVTLRKIAERTHLGAMDVLRTFAILGSCAFSHGTREEEYLREVGGMDRAVLDLYVQAFAEWHGEVVGSCEIDHEDKLGPLLMEARAAGDKSARGEFHTPWALSQLTARMNCPREWTEPRPCRMLEPAAGSGALALAYVEAWRSHGLASERLHCELVDINADACRLAHMQLSAVGACARIILGDTLAHEVRDTWTTPAWEAEREAEEWIAAFAALFGEEAEPAIPTPVEVVREARYAQGKHGQFGFLLDDGNEPEPSPDLSDDGFFS